MKVLGIESSCDETAASVVEDGFRLLSNVIASSADLQAQYGGVVPEIAARSHIEAVNGVVQQALDDAACTWDDIDAIAVTYGAGLGGSLLIGVLTARTLAITHKKPLYACNHVEGHVYANFLTEAAEPRGMRHESRDEAAGAAEPVRSAGASEQRAGEEQAGGEQSDADIRGRGKTPPRLSTWNSSDYQLPTNQPNFPLLALIVSGGHSQLVFFRDHFDYTLLGQTHDDAIGEAFDKVAKIIGLPYPGGPSIGRKATEGDAHAYQFPKAKLTHVSDALLALRQQRAEENRQEMPSHSYDFSFSGIKTAVLRAAQLAIGEDHTFPSKNLPERLSEAQKADIAASFQRVAVETIVDKTLLAYKEFAPASVVIAGGVAASTELRRQLAERLPCPIAYTDPRLCTDNGAMIATLGCFHMKRAHPTADPYTLDIQSNLSM